ncbi:DUF4365 domain-containing protein [Vibrio sp. NTOU-M3]|uniref:DUF4365 domain-containing protein n=1 Tax=Vibrio sp. NTOU-M3 TaxID=3234954 RepID=UPI00349F7323
MNAGEIGTRAGRIFGYNIPDNWMIRDQEDQNDHGIDYEIELKDQDGKALGKESVFKVQLKGQENCSFIEDGQKLSFSVSRERLKYYLKFNIPVLLVVVEVSSEEIYWVSVTDNLEIRNKVEDSETANLTVHLPATNKLERKSTASFDEILVAVHNCWDYLSLRDLKAAVSNCITLKPEALNDRIEQVESALFTAYHIKLEQLLSLGQFPQVFQQASEMFQSPIVPLKDRFIATLYFDYAFKVAPYTPIKRKQVELQLGLCEQLLLLAREQKESPYRLTAMAKARCSLFNIMVEQLHANHMTHQHFRADSIEYLLMNQEIHKNYYEVCEQLVKIINLCKRLIINGEFSILADLMCDLALPIGLFKAVHKERGAVEAISFLDGWFEQMLCTVLIYASKANELFKVKQLYLMANLQTELKSSIQTDIRSLVLGHCPNAEEMLNSLDGQISSHKTPAPFIDSSVEDQKAFFTNLAKGLGMDPDDTSTREGKFIAIGLANYDPTNVIDHCEHLFVDYRPRGLIAEQLRMHSLGMPLLTCLKHEHVTGTGGRLIELFDNPNGPEFALGFKQKYCDKCSDCTPRPDDWSWNLTWQQEERTKHQDWLNKLNF